MSQNRPSESDESKDQALILATEALSGRVSTLAVAIQTNSEMISGLQREINQKPDDAEVKLMTHIGGVERKTIRDRAFAIAVVSALLSAFVAFWVSEERGHDRCAKNQHSINIIIDYLAENQKQDPTIQQVVKDLRENRNPC